MLMCCRCKTSGVDYKNKYRNSGYCRSCHTEKMKTYRATSKGKAAVKRAVKKYEINHPERRLAWNAVARVSTKPCVVCGELRVHKHHPNPLKRRLVVFLCPFHHKQVHLSKVTV